MENKVTKLQSLWKQFSKEKIQNFEKILLKNMTIVLIILIIGIMIFWFLNKIDTSQMITATLAIFAFWYGYKKYERDKAFELMQNNLFLNFDKTDINELLFKWSISYNFYNEGYVEKRFWFFLEGKYFSLFKVILESNKPGEILGNIINYPIYPIYFRNFLFKLKEHYKNNINIYTKEKEGYKKWEKILQYIEIYENIINKTTLGQTSKK